MEECGKARLLWWDLEGVRKKPPQREDLVIRFVRTPSLDLRILRSIDLFLAEAHDLRKEWVRNALLGGFNFPTRPPSLLLTSPEPDNVRFLKEFLVEEVAWTFEPEKEVLARVLPLITTSDRKRLALLLLDHCSGCATLEVAIENLFLGPRPPSRVRDLARACFVSPRTLGRRWKDGHSESIRPSLKGLVDWALLLRAREMSHAGLSPLEIQRELGVHRSTLERATRRLAEITCSDFLRLPHHGLWVLLERHVVEVSGKMTRIA